MIQKKKSLVTSKKQKNYFLKNFENKKRIYLKISKVDKVFLKKIQNFWNFKSSYIVEENNFILKNMED